MSGFQATEAYVSSKDGLNFTLIAPLYYTAHDGREFCAPTGATTDGASTPRIAWTILPPFGVYWRAAILHDAAYRGSLLIGDSDCWKSANLTKDQCDALLKEAMEALGVDTVAEYAIYDGIRTRFADAAFREDRKAEPTTSVVPTLSTPQLVSNP